VCWGYERSCMCVGVMRGHVCVGVMRCHVCVGVMDFASDLFIFLIRFRSEKLYPVMDNHFSNSRPTCPEM
jgi:hypothetical protein